MSRQGHTILANNLRGHAVLFRQLATMETSGLAPQHAIAALERDATPALRTRLERVRQRLHAGDTPGAALLANGLCQQWESQFLQAMQDGGRLGEAYVYLAQQTEARSLRRDRLKARLALPAAVFMLALFVTPLPALVRGELDAWGYCARTLLPLALLLMLTKMLSALLRREQLAIFFLSRSPILGPLIQRQQELHSLAVLGLLLRSGLPASRAIELAATAGTAWSAAATRRAVQATAQGESLGNALASNGLCTDAGDRALILAGENAGRLDDTLERVVRLRQAELDLKLDLWAEWLPRVLYFGAFAPWLL